MKCEDEVRHDSKDCARDPYKNMGCHGCSKSANCEGAFMDYAVHCVRYSNAWDIRFKW